MKILILGTSSGTPTSARNVSALAVRPDMSKQWYLVDCGEGTQHRILQTNLSLLYLQAIFITHVHGDHCYGLPGLLASAGMHKRSERLRIVGPHAVRKYIEGVIETTQLHLPYELEFIDVEQLPAMGEMPDFRVQATTLSHRVPSFAYSFTEQGVLPGLDAAKLAADGIAPGPTWRQIQEGQDLTLPDGRILNAADYRLPTRKPRKIIVGGDNDKPDLLAEEAQDAQVLIHEATYTEEVLAKVGPGPQHSSAKRVARFASEAGIENLVLTHFSPRYHDRAGTGLSLADVEAEARTVYEGRLFLAKDLDRYVLNRQGVLSKTRQ